MTRVYIKSFFKNFSKSRVDDVDKLNRLEAKYLAIILNGVKIPYEI